MLSFNVKFVQTDRRTTVTQYAPDLSIRGHVKKKLTMYFLLSANGFIKISSHFHDKIIINGGTFYFGTAGNMSCKKQDRKILSIASDSDSN